MHAVHIESFGGSEELVLVEMADPKPGRGEAVIAIEAAGVGFMDVMVRQGLYPLVDAPGFIPGAELAGTVESIGEGVQAEWVGRRVFAMPITGGYADKVALRLDQLFLIPDQVTAVQAVALGVNGLVASFALQRVSTQPSDKVLVRGASGGIGMLAVQIAARIGCAVTAMTSSADRGRRLKELGAAAFLDRTSDAAGELGSYDVIIDTVGGAEVGRFLGRLAANGRYVLCGGVQGPPPADFGASMVLNFHNSPSFLAFSLNSVGQPQIRPALDTLFEQVATGLLRPVVDSVLTLAQAPDAHERLQAGQAFGKLVLAP